MEMYRYRKLDWWQKVIDKSTGLIMMKSFHQLLTSVQIILAIFAYYDHEIWQMDVKTAFLNGILKETMYMT